MSYILIEHAFIHAEKYGIQSGESSGSETRMTRSPGEFQVVMIIDIYPLTHSDVVPRNRRPAQGGLSGNQTPGRQPTQPTDYDDLENPLRNAIAEVHLDARGEHRASLIGAAGAERLLRELHHTVFGKVPADDLDAASNASLFNTSVLPRRRSSAPSPIQLPPYRFAKRLFAAQYNLIGTIFSFVRHQTFDEQLQRALQGPPNPNDPDACLEYSKVLIILAFGTLYSVNQWDPYDGTPGFTYFTQALQYLPDLHEEPSILFVETLSLIGYFLQNLNRRDAAFLYVGTSLRMAVSLALHQEVASHHLNEEQKEYRRRVWWSVYSLDRILSIKSGNPITIHDEDIGVRLPSRLPHEAEYCPAVVLRHYTEISRILSRVMILIYRKTPKSGSSLMSSVQSIMASLDQWYKELPQELKFDPERLNISRESVSTLVHYYQCYNMTIRPLLFHIVQKRLKASLAERKKDWSEGLSSTTVKVIETCIAAAHHTIRMMEIAEKKNLLATYGYMDGEHVFSAAIVLVMVYLAFPSNPLSIVAMDSALELLQRIADRGNSQIGTKCAQLMQLRSSISGSGNPAPTPNPAVVHAGIDPGIQGNFEQGLLLRDQNAQAPAFPQVRTAFPDFQVDFLPVDVAQEDFDTWVAGYTNVDATYADLMDLGGDVMLE